jgi:AcrR family transcriptional regulator
MAQRTVSGARRPQRARKDQTTREKLLEVAGQVFAEKGFDRATGKEICERAGANAAAVNYYFGGMDGLYEAVLQEAPSRLVTAEALMTAVGEETDAEAKLESFLGLLVQGLTGPTSSWVPRVMGREIVAPSMALGGPLGKEKLRRARILKAIVCELMGLPEDHPAVARGCISVVAPCLMLLICDRPSLKQMFPSLGLTPHDAPAVVRHLVQFALAGLAAVAADARRNASCRDTSQS